jgi:aminoglycoside N3'-acetyltransferase
MPGVVQSRHPVYRVSALGPLAAPLTAGHEHAKTPAGLGTPFEFMATHDTRIIGIGKPVQVLTQAHHTEDAMGDSFPVPRRSSEPLEMTLVDGSKEFPITLVGSGIQGRFNIWKVRTIMDRTSLQEWTFHHVPMFSTRAKDVSESLSAAARNGVTLYEPL